MGETLVGTRLDHTYSAERVTPAEEIPEEFGEMQRNGQITDARLCYNWEPSENGGRYVECGSVADHAEQDGFVSSEEA